MKRDLVRTGVTILFSIALFTTLFCGCDAINDVPPFIQNVTPTKGTAGTQVTITGSDFGFVPGDNTVRFNGKVGLIISANPYEIQVLVPQSAGTGKVTVQTEAGTTEGPEFKYLDPHTITSVEPSAGPAGAEVVITGENFDDLPGGTTVRFNGTVANVKSLTTTEIVVLVPETAGTGKVTVKTAAGTIDGPIFEYIYSAVVTTYAGDGTLGFANGPALEAKFNFPSGLVFDQTDNLYICDRDINLIRKLDVNTGLVSTHAGSGSSASSDGNGLSASFARPDGITIDAEGNLIVTEFLSGNIRKVTPDQAVTTIAGNGISGFAEGVGSAAQFNAPYGIAINAQGIVFVGDVGNNRIRRVTPEGEVSTLAGNNDVDHVDGTGAAASFKTPYGLVVDQIGNIIVTDGNVLRKVTLEGVVTTIAGTEAGGFTNGPLESAEFKGMRGIARWRSDSFIIADTENNAIRMITPSGTVITIAGDGTAGLQNGNGPTARFNGPYSIAVNSKNEIFVGERNNYVIRKLVLK
ncbi:MAG: IPT/TIG domain-containing protein [Cyclobacteriaceae bacterium]